MVFKARTRDDVADYRMTRLSFTHTPQWFEHSIFFSENKLVGGDKLNVRVTVFSGAYNIPLVAVTTTCSRDGPEYTMKLLQRLEPEGAFIVDMATLDGGKKPPDEKRENGHEQGHSERSGYREGSVDIVKAVAQRGKGNQYPF